MNKKIIAVIMCVTIAICAISCAGPKSGCYGTRGMIGFGHK
jgi:hypothetical protein